MFARLLYQVHGFKGTGYLISRVRGTQFRRSGGTRYITSHYPYFLLFNTSSYGTTNLSLKIPEYLIELDGKYSYLYKSKYPSKFLQCGTLVASASFNLCHQYKNRI